jgi:hypothetical protein
MQQRCKRMSSLMFGDQLLLRALLMHCLIPLHDSPVCLERRHSTGSARTDAARMEHPISVQHDATSAARVPMHAAGSHVAAAERLGGGEHWSQQRSRRAEEGAKGAPVRGSTEHQPAMLNREAREGDEGHVMWWGWLRRSAWADERRSPAVPAAARHENRAQGRANQHEAPVRRRNERCRQAVALIVQHHLVAHSTRKRSGELTFAPSGAESRRQAVLSKSTNLKLRLAVARAGA